MTNARTCPSSRPSLTSSRRLRHTGVALLFSVAALAGCGGSDGGAFDEFAGIWIPDPAVPAAMQTAQMTCSGQMIDELALVWGGLTFERGELTDLNEIGPCLISYDVNGKVATPSNPDPYVPMGGVQVCQTVIERSSGEPGGVILPSAGTGNTWTFTLLDTPAGKAPQGELRISIPSAAEFLTINAVTQEVDRAMPCSYNVSLRVIKLTKS